MRNLLLLLSFSMAFFIQELHAQTVVSGTAEDINAVKLQQGRYIFAESTDKSESVAIENAKTLLADEVSSRFTSTPGKNTPSVAHARIIVAKRGPYFRAFAYVDMEGSAKLEERIPAPDKVAPRQAKTVAETPVVVDEKDVESSRVEETERSSLMEITRFDQMKALIGSLDADGLLIDYGKYATLPESGDCYIVIYDRTGLIKARLKRESKSIRNMVTGETDDPSNYPGCGALWFRTFNSRLN